MSAGRTSQGMVNNGKAASSQRSFKASVISDGKGYFPVLTTSPAASAAGRGINKTFQPMRVAGAGGPVVKMKA